MMGKGTLLQSQKVFRQESQRQNRPTVEYSLSFVGGIIFFPTQTFPERVQLMFDKTISSATT